VLVCVKQCRTCNSRSGGWDSPRRDMQGLIILSFSRFSLRRRVLSLGDPDTRSGEWGSPKRDSDEIARVERDFSSRRGLFGF